MGGKTVEDPRRENRSLKAHIALGILVLSMIFGNIACNISGLVVDATPPSAQSPIEEQCTDLENQIEKLYKQRSDLFEKEFSDLCPTPPNPPLDLGDVTEIITNWPCGGDPASAADQLREALRRQGREQAEIETQIAAIDKQINALQEQLGRCQETRDKQIFEAQLTQMAENMDGGDNSTPEPEDSEDESLWEFLTDPVHSCPVMVPQEQMDKHSSPSCQYECDDNGSCLLRR